MHNCCAVSFVISYKISQAIYLGYKGEILLWQIIVIFRTKKEEIFNINNVIYPLVKKGQTTKEVTKIFEYLQELLAEDDYKKLFQVILTDNGHEFFDVLNIKCHYKNSEVLSKGFIAILVYHGRNVVLKKITNLLK